MMKKFISVMLTAALTLSELTGCGSSRPMSSSPSISTSSSAGAASGLAQKVSDIQTTDLDFGDLSDPELQRYLVDAVYSDLIDKLDSDEYFVENVEATYVSKEYLDELTYNSQANIFFGYTLAELENVFQDERYIFTQGEDGQTIVKALEDYDDTYDRALGNMAVGGGVILVCVTISAVTAGTLPAASAIFAVSAKTGTVAALSSGVISGSAAAIFTGLRTGDMEEALKAGALNGSNDFKWGAIGGAISGGATEAIGLRGAATNGLTMNQVATIQKESKYPLDVIKQFNNMEQYEICKKAGLQAKMVGKKTALIRDIDLDYVDEMGRTNLERMREGLAALDPATGKAFELHHVGQQADSTLAMLTQKEHRLGENYKIWHILSESTVHSSGNTWNRQRMDFWKSLADVLSNAR